MINKRIKQKKKSLNNSGRLGKKKADDLWPAKGYFKGGRPQKSAP